MCNCGKSRLGLSATPATAGAGDVVMGRGAPSDAKALFEYVGPTALTVFGPASGRRYRFERPGATLAADPRDHGALRLVPQLRLRGSA